jgi:hypothetical protein
MEDLRGILRKNPDRDEKYLRYWLEQFDQALQTDLLNAWESLKKSWLLRLLCRWRYSPMMQAPSIFISEKYPFHVILVYGSHGRTTFCDPLFPSAASRGLSTFFPALPGSL